ncbi:septum site-determining protein MinC [Geomicrobium halophilum]|uniref:Probable septum site-determining protein MinC n=1 Tax=Geomicrobium halophilum TaxID=549000 RepID=A0A841PPX3_9BACL|nr:septum site-determining protein MinC [Geomicrobium halophilum]
MKTEFSKQLVTIKGTKDGLVIRLDDHCAYADLLEELQTKMKENMIGEEQDKDVHIAVHVGTRYVDEKQRGEITSAIEQSGAISVDEITSDVITMTQALKMKEEKQIHSYTCLVRSGQVLSVKGDLLILGDVNPGGTIEATGDVYVLGTLKGKARAGTEGDEDAVIAASVLAPSQLMIADRLYLSEATREQQESESMHMGPRYASIEEEKEEMVFHNMSSLAALRSRRQKAID